MQFNITVIQQWEAAGKPVWELLEPVDGFHSNQVNYDLYSIFIV